MLYCQSDKSDFYFDVLLSHFGNDSLSKEAALIVKKNRQ